MRGGVVMMLAVMGCVPLSSILRWWVVGLFSVSVAGEEPVLSSSFCVMLADEVEAFLLRVVVGILKNKFQV